MHCFKRPGERVMARTFERQGVELPVRVAWLNRFMPLGQPTEVRQQRAFFRDFGEISSLQINGLRRFLTPN
jgi:hypothetical protein